MAKLTDLQTVSQLTTDDLIYLVDDPAGTPVSKKASVAQLLALLGSANLPEINVLNYGVKGDGSTDDYAKVQDAFNAAYDLGLAKVVFPNTAQNRYMFSNTVINTINPDRGRVPVVSSVDTATHTVTWNKKHLLKTGDPVMIQGYAWGGITRKVQYYALYVDDLRTKFYDTKANALAGGATGLITFSSGVTTTGTISSGQATLTVANVLNVEKGTDVRINGVINPNGDFFARSIAGNVITLNANASGNATSATVTFVASMDWRYYRTGLRIEIAEGVTLAKAATFNGTSIFSISNTFGVTLRGGRFEGLTPDLNSSINPGDDLLRFNSNRLLLISQVAMFHAGDAGLRVATSTGDPIAATASFPEDGVGQSVVRVEKCYTYNCHQWSTTTNDYMHGGGSEIWFEGNTFENLRGSCKLASRTPGARNVILNRNIFKSGLDKGFEIDSCGSILCQGNIFQSVANFAFFLTPNNGPAASPSGDGSGVTGFAFNYLKLYDNYFIKCATATNNAAIRLNMDIYSDGFRWDYDGVDISRNHFVDMATSGCFAISVLGSSVKNFRIKDNEFLNFNGSIALRLHIRGSASAGFVNNIDVSDNIFTMTNSAATAIWLQRNGGTEKINEVHLNDNKIYGSLTACFVLGDLKNVFIDRNRVNVTSGFVLQTNTGQTIEEMHVTRNRVETTGNSGWLFSDTTGLYVEDNHAKTAAGSTYSFANTCTNVWFSPKANRSTGGTANLRQVPVNSAGIGATGRDEFGSAAPTSGTWRVGDRVMSQAATSGQPMGFQCTVKGTAGSIAAAATGTTNGSTNTFTASSVVNLAVGAFINVNGAWSGGRTITAINTTTLAVTVDGAVPAAVSGASITYVNPTFSNLANVA